MAIPPRSRPSKYSFSLPALARIHETVASIAQARTVFVALWKAVGVPRQDRPRFPARADTLSQARNKERKIQPHHCWSMSGIGIGIGTGCGSAGGAGVGSRK
jgi:hypothetical protein